MIGPPEPAALEELRRKVAEKSRQLSELDVMLTDYWGEWDRLVCDLRHLSAQLREAEEQLDSEAEAPSGPSS
jgi:uncharacterized coiled-coil protein SlyX